MRQRPIRPGWLEAAVRVGRRRRRRYVAGTAGTGVAAVVAIALLAQPGGPQSLHEVKQPTVTESPSPAASAVATRTGAPSPSASPAASGGSPSATASTEPAPDDERTPLPPPETRAQRHADLVVGTEPASFCGVDTDAAGWCTMSNVFRRGDGPFQLTYKLCRPTGNERASLRYATAQELDLVVARDRDGREPLWRWSSGRTFATAPHTVVVEQGLCRTWSTTWDVTTDDGDDVGPGKYWLLIRQLSPDGPEAVPAQITV